MSVGQKLLRWYEKNGRSLPWRETRDPYAILVSEIMLHQTQVDRVIPYYTAWLERFPNWQTLAEAPSAEAIRHWSGLGYNRRALMLHQCAKHVIRNGEPRTYAEWISIKGIGPYTAAVLCVFTRTENIPPVDTNIRRVIGRHSLGIEFPQLEHDKQVRAAYSELFGSTHNYHLAPQALFDLAATTCKKSPICATCPLKTTCASAQAFLSGKVQIPKQTVKKANERHHRNKPHPDRIYRGRIVKAVNTQRHVLIGQLGHHIDPDFVPKKDTQWVRNMLNRLEADGLIEQTHTYITLPGGKNTLQ